MIRTGESWQTSKLSLGQVMSKVMTQVDRQLAQDLTPLQLTSAAFAVIEVLMSRTGPTTQADLAQLVGVRQPTMAVTLRRMERDELICRVSDPSDGRQSLVKMSRKTARKRTRLLGIRERVEEKVFGGLDEAERGELGRLLRKVRAEKADCDGTP